MTKRELSALAAESKALEDAYEAVVLEHVGSWLAGAASTGVPPCTLLTTWLSIKLQELKLDDRDTNEAPIAMFNACLGVRNAVAAFKQRTGFDMATVLGIDTPLTPHARGVDPEREMVDSDSAFEAARVKVAAALAGVAGAERVLTTLVVLFKNLLTTAEVAGAMAAPSLVAVQGTTEAHVRAEARERVRKRKRAEARKRQALAALAAAAAEAHLRAEARKRARVSV